MQRIAVAAHKGGSGKTTVTVNLAGALAARGQTVLVVDADPQGAATAALGAPPAKPSLYEVLAGEATIEAAARPTATPGVSVVGADLDLAGAEVELPRAGAWQGTLRERLAAADGFDVALIDTAPGLGVLPYVALVAAERVLIVCPPDYLSLRSLPSILEATSRARVPMIGIVPNRVEHRTRHEADVLAQLRTDHGAVLLSEVPGRVALRDAAIAGVPVATYAPASDAAEAFDRLAQEVLDHAPT